MATYSARRVEPPVAVMAFVDAGYLIAGAAKSLRLPSPVRIDGDWLATWASHAWVAPQGGRLLRAYVYDAEHVPAHPGYNEQRAAFDFLASQSRIRLRLGQLVERSGGSRQPTLQQKGVDTLLVLDLVRMAQQRAFDVALLVAGDRDLAEAVRVVADDYGRQVVLYGVAGAAPAKALIHASDDFGEIDNASLREMLTWPGKDTAAKSGAQGGAPEGEAPHASGSDHEQISGDDALESKL